MTKWCLNSSLHMHPICRFDVLHVACARLSISGCVYAGFAQLSVHCLVSLQRVVTVSLDRLKFVSCGCGRFGSVILHGHCRHAATIGSRWSKSICRDARVANVCGQDLYDYGCPIAPLEFITHCKQMIINGNKATSLQHPRLCSLCALYKPRALCDAQLLSIFIHSPRHLS